MLGLVTRLAINAMAMLAAIQFVDGLTFTGHWASLLFITIAMAVVNAAIKPLATLFSMPLVILSLGLFILLINALMLSVVLFVSDVFHLGLFSADFSATFVAALVISLVSWLLTALFGDAA